MSEKLKIIQWNARSLYKAKLAQFKVDLNSLDPDIVLLCETFWNDKYKAMFSAYHPFVNNRTDRRGGGVAILVKKNIPAKPHATPSTEKVEAIGIMVKLKTKTINITSVYCPHGDCDKKDILDLLNTAGDSAIVGGDFNAHSELWEDSTTPNRAGSALEEALMESSDFTLCTPRNLGTRRGQGSISTIDLTLATTDLFPIINITKGPNDWRSDHIPVLITVDIHPQRTNHVFRWRFRDKNWNRWNEDIATSLEGDNRMKSTDPLTAYDALQEAITSASRKHFNPGKQKPTREPRPYWWNDDCGRAISEARKARREWLNNPVSRVLKNKLNHLEKRKDKIIQRSIDEAWATHITTLETDKNGKKFWYAAQAMVGNRRTQTAFPTLTDSNPDPGTARDPATILLDHFCPQEHTAGYIIDPEEAELLEEIEHATKEATPQPYNERITAWELNKALHLPLNKAMGPDLIHNQMLTRLSSQNRRSLLEVFNKLLEQAEVPDSWKTAVVVPIHKRGKPADKASSYRPVALTSSVSKVFEKIINCRLQWQLSKVQAIPQNQAGFRPGRATIDNVAQLEAEIKKGFNKREQTTVIFLDLQQAFDRAWPTGVLIKLLRAGILGSLLAWFRNFLTRRTIQVRASDCLSARRMTTRGVPQGSVLSPTLFNVLMADFPTPEGPTKSALFADDIAVYRSGRTSDEIEPALNNFLSRISKWADKWRLSFSVEKCAALTFTLGRKPPPTLKMRDQPIPTVSRFKFLGMLMDKKLTWNDHMNQLRVYSLRTLNLFKMMASKKARMSPLLQLRAYKALVGAKIDYGAPLLTKANKTHKAKLETVQNQFLRTITGARRSTPANLLKIETGIEPIEDRWNWLATSYFTKLSNKPGTETYRVSKEVANLAEVSSIRAIPAAFTICRDLKASGIHLFGKSNNTMTQDPIPPWSEDPAAFKFFRLSKRAANSNHNEANLLFQESIASDASDHLHIYTDGSKCPTKGEASCGLYAPSLNLKKSWTLTKGSSVFKSELVAIREAVRVIDKSNASLATIFTDSASAVAAIQNRQNRPPIVPEIIRSLINLKAAGTRVTIAWIPSHVGIHGNEVADELASGASTDPTSEHIDNELCPGEVLSTLKNHRAKEILTKLKASSNNWALTKHTFLGPRDWLFHRDKSTHAALTRLRSGHNGLKAFTGLWKRDDADEPDIHCENSSCQQTRETVPHVLLHCPAHAVHRERLTATLIRLHVEPTTTNILGLNSSIPKHKQMVIRNALISFLQDSGLIKRL
jgi:ribonuclease HI/endonuclease/exonuclease/phosphatase family metal-dependent hydrolase